MAVEGSILLIDSTQGVQAQTLTTLAMACLSRYGQGEEASVIIPVITKIDSPLARITEVKEEVVKLLNCDPNKILLTSGRTGEGIDHLLQEIIKRIPAPVELGHRMSTWTSDVHLDIGCPSSARAYF